MKSVELRGRKNWLLAGGIAALLCAQCLYGALVLSALYKQYREPALIVQGLLCENIADHLSRLVRFGKTLRVQTLEHFLDPYYSRTDAENIVITDSSGTVLTAWTPPGRTFPIPEKSKVLYNSVREFPDDRYIWLTHDVRDRKNAIVGHVLLAVDKEQLSASLWDTARSQLQLFLSITAGVCLLLVALFYFVVRPSSKRKSGTESGVSRLRLYGCLILPLVLGQLLFMFLLRAPLHDVYEQEMQHVGHQLGRQLAWDLERLVRLGLPVAQLPPVEDHLSHLQRSLFQTKGMAIFTNYGTLQGAANAEGPLDAVQWGKAAEQAFVAKTRVHDAEFEARGTGVDGGGEVVILMSPSVIDTNLWTITLDTLTMTVVAVLFLMELIMLLLMRGHGKGTDLAERSISPQFMRPIIFVCLFATDLSSSYMPLRIGELGLDLFGLPPDVVTGLPVSFELFMVGVAIMIGGFWSQKSGWRPMLLTGIALAAFGAGIGGFARTPLIFILSCGLFGVGYGFINLSAQVFVIAHSSADARAGNLGFMFAGLYAGTLCGSAMGGLVADRLGYAAVFPVSAVLLFLICLVLWRLLPRESWKQAVEEQGRLSFRDCLRFLGDRRMGALLLLNIIPCALVTVCLFQFFIPVSLNQAGTNPATIGRIFMLFCIVVMYLGPLCGRTLDRSGHKERFLFAGQLAGAMSVVTLLCFDGVLGATISILLLGLCNAVVTNGQGAFALELPAAAAFGKSRTMGMYNVAMRIGQVLGPMTLGIAATLWNVGTGLTFLAIFLVGSGILFFAACFGGGHDRRHE